MRMCGRCVWSAGRRSGRKGGPASHPRQLEQSHQSGLPELRTAAAALKLRALSTIRCRSRGDNKRPREGADRPQRAGLGRQLRPTPDGGQNRSWTPLDANCRRDAPTRSPLHHVLQQEHGLASHPPVHIVAHVHLGGIQRVGTRTVT